MTTLDEARAERERDIEVLRACECMYPLEVVRNSSGHRADCPGHALWMSRRWAHPEPGLGLAR